MKFKLFLVCFLTLIPFFGQVNASYNINSVYNNWLTWTNNERLKTGAGELVINENLSQTALSWSEYSKNRGYIDHKRKGQKAFYDYKKISSWFTSKGLSFKNVNGITFSESIGRNTYSCKKDDCTESISNAVYKTFAMYLKEKGKKYAPHYNSMISKGFSQIGIGIVVDETKKKYYITVHYGTEVVLNK